MWALQSVHIRHPCPRTSHRIRKDSQEIENNFQREKGKKPSGEQQRRIPLQDDSYNTSMNMTEAVPCCLLMNYIHFNPCALLYLHWSRCLRVNMNTIIVPCSCGPLSSRISDRVNGCCKDVPLSVSPACSLALMAAHGHLRVLPQPPLSSSQPAYGSGHRQASSSPRSMSTLKPEKP